MNRPMGRPDSGSCTGHRKKTALFLEPARERRGAPSAKPTRTMSTRTFATVPIVLSLALAACGGMKTKTTTLPAVDQPATSAPTLPPAEDEVGSVAWTVNGTATMAALGALTVGLAHSSATNGQSSAAGNLLAWGGGSLVGGAGGFFLGDCARRHLACRIGVLAADTIAGGIVLSGVLIMQSGAFYVPR